LGGGGTEEAQPRAGVADGDGEKRAGRELVHVASL
jgi:hypothetical protein